MERTYPIKIRMNNFGLIDRLEGVIDYMAYRAKFLIPSYPPDLVSRPDPAMDLKYFMKRARSRRHYSN